jgi:hypothetical protein
VHVEAVPTTESAAAVATQHLCDLVVGQELVGPKVFELSGEEELVRVALVPGRYTPGWLCDPDDVAQGAAYDILHQRSDPLDGGSGPLGRPPPEAERAVLLRTNRRCGFAFHGERQNLAAAAGVRTHQHCR